MRGRKLCGYDLNGWGDRAARNWCIGPDGEESAGAGILQVTGAVLQPSVVRTGEGRGARWIGGAQARLAPHGRGGGWGDIGAPDRRATVRDLMAAPQPATQPLAAALAGLASGARVCAIALDDHPARSEDLQEALLAAVAQGRLGRGLLVWRSVLAVLGCLAEEADWLAPDEGLTLGVINHVGEGFTLQKLRLRREMGRGRALFAPERRRMAQPIDSPLGYAGLFDAARKALIAGGAGPRGDWADHAQARAALALGRPARAELLRTERGDFFQIDPPGALELPPDDRLGAIAGKMAACTMILFESLTMGAMRDALLKPLRAAWGSALIDLPEDIIARGALEAARRHDEGEPVYFDFLPQISTIVLGQDGARSHDLIEPGATLPAGRIYRSAEPAKFAIQAGQAEFSVHLRKELAPWPRKARVEIGAPVSEIVPVSLSVEQVPAAGRARLLIDAPRLSRQFTVDWEGATELHRPWEDLVVELDGPAPTIPKRLVLPCGMELWEDSPAGQGLTSLLAQNLRSPQVDWKVLADKLSARKLKRHCISSDGDIPDQVPEQSRAHLEQLTERALAELEDRRAGRRGSNDNHALKFLTWQFRRAPDAIPAMLLEAWQDRAAGRKHPFALSEASWVLIYQGLGRTCRSEEDERIAVARLFARPVEKWSYRQETAAAAFLLSRSDTAPLLLERSHVEQLAERVLMEFAAEHDTNYTRFNYAPFLLGGLLRWRLKEGNALVEGLDPLADALSAAIERTLSDFARHKNRNETFLRAVSHYEPLLEQLLDELAGEGRNPDLLVDLYDA